MLRLTDGRGANVVLDLVGGETFAGSLRAAARAANVVALANVALAPSVIDTRDFYPKNVHIHGFQITDLMEHGYDPRPDLAGSAGRVGTAAANRPGRLGVPAVGRRSGAWAVGVTGSAGQGAAHRAGWCLRPGATVSKSQVRARRVARPLARTHQLIIFGPDDADLEQGFARGAARPRGGEAFLWSAALVAAGCGRAARARSDSRVGWWFSRPVGVGRARAAAPTPPTARV